MNRNLNHPGIGSKYSYLAFKGNFMSEEFFKIPMCISIYIDDSFTIVSVSKIGFGTAQTHLIGNQSTHPVVKGVVMLFEIQCCSFGGGNDVFTLINVIINS